MCVLLIKMPIRKSLETYLMIFVYIYIYIYICISLSSSCLAISTDISDPLSPPLPIVHSFWQIFRATSCICTELLYVCSSWMSCLCWSLWRSPQEYITYELVPTSPAVSCMSGLSNFDSFRDGGGWPSVQDNINVSIKQGEKNFN